MANESHQPGHDHGDALRCFPPAHGPDAERQPELLHGIWHAPRGPVTKTVAWLLLAMIALGLLAMLASVVWGSGV